MGSRQHRTYPESDALKDQIMNDPGSAREFRNVTRDPLLQSGPAAGEEALIEIKSAVLAKLVLARALPGRLRDRLTRDAMSPPADIESPRK